MLRKWTSSSASKRSRSSRNTSWPDDSSSDAAWSTASRHAGATSIPRADTVLTAIRSRPGSAPTSSVNGRALGGELHQASGSGPLTTSRIAAASATVRVSAPSTDSPDHPGTRSGTRPRLGLCPTSPQHEDGMRIDPPPSLALAAGNMPEATAAAAPPLDPPGVNPGFQGFRVMPYREFSVMETEPNSGELVRPHRTNPASTKACTTRSDSAAGASDAPARPVGHGLAGHPDADP